MSEWVIDFSNFDSEIPVTATLLNLPMYLSLSFLGSRLLIFKCIRCKTFGLKLSHSVVFNRMLIFWVDQ